MDVIKNGNFAIEGPSAMYPFLHWISDGDLDENDKIVYVASSTYDDELKSTCCRMKIIEERLTHSYPSIPGIMQVVELNRVTQDTKFQLEFLAKRISGADYVTVFLLDENNDFEKITVKITDPSYSWVKCSCEFDLSGSGILSGNGEYIVAITAAQTGSGASLYEPQEFLLSDVKSNITNCISPYINVVQGSFDTYGDFSSYWTKETSGNDTTYNVDVKNGILSMSSQRDYIGVRQGLDIPSFISLSSPI